MTQRMKSRKMRKVSASKQLEVAYRRELEALLRHMLDISLAVIKEEPQKINDAPTDWLKALAAKANRISDLLDNIDYSSISKRIARRVVNRANQVNAKRFGDNVENQFGIDLQGQLLRGNPEIRDALEIATEYNASLIRSHAAQFKERINSTIMNSVQSGVRSTNLITQMMEDFGVSFNKAKFLARDQTSKMNGDLSRIRAESVGAKTYIWSGSLDERERKSHRVMEGKLCKYSDPTVYSDDGGKTWKKRKAIGGVELHPSQDFSCRCNGRAVITFT